MVASGKREPPNFNRTNWNFQVDNYLPGDRGTEGKNFSKMKKIKLISHGETVEFVKAHSEADEWKAISSAGTQTTGWTTEEVEKKVEELKQKGFEEAIR